MNIFSIAVIGVGRMGGALSLALSRSGYEIRQLVTRKYDDAKRIAELIEPRPQVLSSEEFERISADVIFIATPDSEIAHVSEQLAEKLEHLPLVFHTSGALPSTVLSRLSDEGCEIGSFHPLVSISDAISGAERFENAYFCIEGDIEAVNIAEQIIRDLKGQPFSIETKFKSLYHASAVTASGHFVALMSAAIEMLSECGLGKEEAQKILLPLVQSTVRNLSAQTPWQALTGPFARADVETMKKHLETLQENVSSEAFDIYRILGERALLLARQQGGNEGRLEEMRQILDTVSSERS